VTLPFGEKGLVTLKQTRVRRRDRQFGFELFVCELCSDVADRLERLLGLFVAGHGLSVIESMARLYNGSSL